MVDEFPELAETGAYAADKVYTPDDVQDVVQYANQVGALEQRWSFCLRSFAARH